eukprot:gene15831-55426_t
MDNYQAHTLAVRQWRLFLNGEQKWLILPFLPPNMTAWLQPLDCGVMGPFKKAFKTRRRRRITAQLYALWKEG